MRLVRHPAAALAALALAVVAAGTVRAAPPPGDPPAQPPAKDDAPVRTEAEVGRESAATLWAAAVQATRATLHEFARDAAVDVLADDPDHEAARKLLGFVRADGVWREDPARAAHAPPANFEGKRIALDKAAQEERKWWRGPRAKARAAAAAVWSSFGEECTARGDPGTALRAHRRAVALDPENAASRRALGHFQWEHHWWTEAQYRAVTAATRATPVDTESAADKALGTKLPKVQSAHFRIEGRLPQAELADLARAVETAYAVHLLDAGREPTESVFPSPVRFVVCTTDAEWNAWIDKFVPRNKEFFRGLTGAWAENWHYAMRPVADGRAATRRDHLVHRAVHAVNSYALGVNWPSWLDEGLCFLTSVRLEGMTRTWCLAPAEGDYAKLDRSGGQAGWIEEAEWDAALKATALARDDVPLRTLVGHPLTEQTFAAAMKAWSVLDAWRSLDPQSYRDLLPKIRGPKDPAAAIEKHFGRSLEDLDEEWRRWVLRR